MTHAQAESLADRIGTFGAFDRRMIACVIRHAADSAAGLERESLAARVESLAARVEGVERRFGANAPTGDVLGWLAAWLDGRTPESVAALRNFLLNAGYREAAEQMAATGR